MEESLISYVADIGSLLTELSHDEIIESFKTTASDKSPLDSGPLDPKTLDNKAPLVQGSSLGQKVSGVGEVASKFMRDPVMRVMFLFVAAGLKTASLGLSLTRDSFAHSVIAIMKRESVEDLREEVDLRAQLQIMSLASHGYSSFLETLESLLQHTLKPTLVEDGASGGVLGSVKKKAQELCVSMHMVQQSDGIPKVSIVADKAVHDVAVKVWGAEAAEGGKATEVGPEIVVKVPQYNKKEYVDELQEQLNQWNESIAALTTFDDKCKTKAIDELSYWQCLEDTLSELVDRLAAPEVRLQVAVLVKNHRATNYLENLEPKVKRASNDVREIREFVTKVPLDKLAAADQLGQITDAIGDIFQAFHHVHQLRKKYSYQRASSFLEATSRMMVERTVDILVQQDFVTFKGSSLNRDLAKIFDTWDSEWRTYSQRMRENLKKDGDNTTGHIYHKSFAHLTLKQRVESLKDVRKNYDKATEVLQFALRHGGMEDGLPREDVNETMDIIKGLQAAIYPINNSSFYDLSLKGEENWKAAVKEFGDNMDKCHKFIAEKIGHEVAGTKKSNDLLQIFRDYNSLLDQPRIRKAVKSSQSRFVKSLAEEFRSIDKEYRERQTQGCVPARVCGISDSADYIKWLQQLGKRAELFKVKMGIVLGDSWSSTQDGKELRANVEKFQEGLNYASSPAAYLGPDKTESFPVDKAIFDIRDTTKGGAPSYDIKLSVSEEDMDRCRTLRLVGPPTSRSIKMYTSGYQDIYSGYYQIKESLELLKKTEQTFNQGIRDAGDKQSLEAIKVSLAPFYNKLTTIIKKGATSSKWENGGVNLADDFCDAVADIEAQYYHMRQRFTKINQLVNKLAIIPLHEDYELFSNISTQLETQFNEIPDADLSVIVETLNSDLLNCLRTRVLEAIGLWRNDFTNVAVKSKLFREPFIVNAMVRKRQIIFEPNVGQIAQHWYDDFHRTLRKLMIFQKFTLVKGQRIPFEALTEFASPTELSGAYLATYQTIEGHVESMRSDLDYFRGFTNLWVNDLTSMISEERQNDLSAWLELMNALKELKNDVGKMPGRKSFGYTVLNLAMVIPRINEQIERRVKELAQILASKLDRAIVLTREIANSTRPELEAVKGLDNVTFIRLRALDIRREEDCKEYCDMIGCISDLLSQFEKASVTIQSHSAVVDLLLDAQNALAGHEYKLSVPAERAVGEWFTCTQVMQKNAAALQKNKGIVHDQLRVAEEQVEQGFAALKEHWRNRMQLGGSADPVAAVASLQEVEAQKDSLHQCLTVLNKAREVLHMKQVDKTQEFEELEMDIAGVKGVWDELGRVCAQLEDLKNTDWASLVPRKMRAQLAALETEMKQLPASVQEYEACDTLQEKIKYYVSINTIINDLKNEAVKERHWKEVVELLHIHKDVEELTLGDLYDAMSRGAEEDRKLVLDRLKELLVKARGEHSILAYMQKIKDYWNETSIDWVDYKLPAGLGPMESRKEGRVDRMESRLAGTGDHGKKSVLKLMMNLEDVYEKLDEDMDMLRSMTMSIYNGEYIGDIQSWESKLSSLRILLGEYEELQRKWLYLMNIFNSSEIKTTLAEVYPKFVGVNRDITSNLYYSLINKEYYINIDVKLIQLITKYNESLSNIQKNIYKYLENQRNQFPRFYFIGDDDLLELIGHSKDLNIIQKHISKMFYNIQNVETDLRGDIISIISADGGKVVLEKEVNIRDSSVIEWLNQLERQMKETLQKSLVDALVEYANGSLDTGMDELIEMGAELYPCEVDQLNLFHEWCNKYPPQITILALQILWTRSTEVHIRNKTVGEFFARLELALGEISGLVFKIGDDSSVRVRHHNLVTELVHQRDVLQLLVKAGVSSVKDFVWLKYTRFYLVYDLAVVRVSSASFNYGYEYLGLTERLVQTQLTDNCILTMGEALHLRLGGNPFGPAGTGKTETVKFFGQTLGLFVLVFNCDETFDFSAMNRILSGLCQVGAWGCLDEFNRLEEKILSAVSEQILIIQSGLRQKKTSINLLNVQNAKTAHSIQLSENVGIFVTMNPGYAGRSNLPDNLKQLFREFAMVAPDKTMIAEVILFSQGFTTATKLAPNIVQFFEHCHQTLSHQSHYDFGLRALKSVLSVAGTVNRLFAGNKDEPAMLLKALNDSILSQLVAEDVPKFESALSSLFPNREPLHTDDEQAMVDCVHKACQTLGYSVDDNFINKILQLYRACLIRHGIMLVGPTGSGKTAALDTFILATQMLQNIPTVKHLISPKAMDKKNLFGTLNSTSLEWWDGIFTSTLRKVMNSKKINFIVFDGDVDPQWAENLNSLLDDNALFTLPSGERFKINDRIKIIFETDSLKFATPATVSRCGMLYMNERQLSVNEVIGYKIDRLQKGNMSEKSAAHPASLKTPGQVSYAGSSGITGSASLNMGNMNMGSVNMASMGSMSMNGGNVNGGGMPPVVGYDEGISVGGGDLRSSYCDVLRSVMVGQSLVAKCLDAASGYRHVVPFTRIRVVENLFCLLSYHITYLTEEAVESLDARTCVLRALSIFIVWAFGASIPIAGRLSFAKDVERILVGTADDVDLSPPEGLAYLQVIPDLVTGAWRVLSESLSGLSHGGGVIETSDTLAHSFVINAYLSSGSSFILCGPPGSGKTMTLTAVLQAHPAFDVAMLNYSSGTTPETLMKTFHHYCEFVKTTAGYTMRPKQVNKKLVIFADEINLPQPDEYGTQRVISLMRQIETTHCFHMPVKGQWTRVEVERVQFAGACNPPEDAGRHPMSDRWLRVAPLVFIDFPGEDSLLQIYGTFMSQVMASTQQSELASPLTRAMVAYYLQSQRRFSTEPQPHYIYSPRELTRWKVAIQEVVNQWTAADEDFSTNYLVRLAMHEGERIFVDRLVTHDERMWGRETLAQCFREQFGDDANYAWPILFTQMCGEVCEEVDRDRVRQFLASKLQTFYEEEAAIKLVLFDECLEHVLHIDRVLRQPLGHLLLVGVSGVGKTILSRFTSWIQGLEIFEIKPGRDYGLTDFENDLRTVMKRAGVKSEKLTFIFDESNVFGPGFLERMNALLASGEVPGLFEQDSLAQLLSECRSVFENASDDDQEIFATFTHNVQINLHIVFTMNPQNRDFYDRKATSPALFNRCVIDWFGDWSREALFAVAEAFATDYELENESFEQGAAPDGSPEEHLATVAEAVVSIHEAARRMTDCMRGGPKKSFYCSPREFLDLIKHLTKYVNEKRQAVMDDEKHLNTGLFQLQATEKQVEELRQSLSTKETELAKKQALSKQTMTDIIAQKTEAEEKKAEAQKLTAALNESESEIKERKSKVQKELSEVEPQLKMAQEKVQSIPKSAIDELKSLSSPPAVVKLVLEAVTIMLTNAKDKAVTWEECRKTMQQGSLVNKVLTFDHESLDSQTVQKIKAKYLSSTEWNENRVAQASRAAGPMASWVTSSITYADIKLKVEPLSQEIAQLESALKQNKEQLERTNKLTRDLEEQLTKLQNKYAELIAEEQAIGSEVKNVTNKIASSSALLAKLSSEQERWTTSSKACRSAFQTSVGDNLLAAAFSTYLGFFEQSDRDRLLAMCKAKLEELGIRYNKQLSLVEYLSDSKERYRWTSALGLSNDQLSIENACIMLNHIRYPIFIDPSNRIVEFLTKLYGENKVLKSSVSHPQFVKHLESALRFGNTLIIQDIERMVPVLGHILNRETRQHAGRTLVNVGDTEVDVSPEFRLYLVTTNGEINLTPDFSSRLTVINCCITPSSLKAQSLDAVLQCEHPAVDKRRRDALRLQGETRAKIRELESGLLQALSNVKGSILNDDVVIKTLEDIKTKSEQVTKQAANADQVFEEVNQVTNQYIPLANAATMAFTALDHMSSIHWLYQFDVNLFEKIYMNTIQNQSKPEHQINDSQRAELLTDVFFLTVYRTYALSMLYNHRLIFALELARIRWEIASDHKKLSDLDEYKVLVDVANVPEITPESRLRDDNIAAAIGRCPSLKGFRQSVEAHPGEWETWVAGDGLHLLDPPMELLDSDLRLLQMCVLVKYLRPDRLSAALSEWIVSVMGPMFRNPVEFRADGLADLIKRDILETNRVLLLVSSPGFEPAQLIGTAAKMLNRQCQSIALGSREGYEIAEKMMKNCAQHGHWLVLKNVHLADKEWLNNQHKLILKASSGRGGSGAGSSGSGGGIEGADPGFRCFMTTIFKEDSLPSEVLKRSMKFVFETPKGLKSALERTWNNHVIPRPSLGLMVDRLYFLLAMMHAIVLERRRFEDIGWTKPIDFSDADLVCGLEIIDEWLSSRDGVVPWDALRELLCTAIYGGRVDSKEDLDELSRIVSAVINEKLLNPNKEIRLGDKGTGLKTPEVSKDRSMYSKWIADEIPAEESPEWSGLPHNAENILNEKLGLLLIDSWEKLHINSLDSLQDFI
ncbi:putative dynein heavy chain [Gregarina niphandrodes]|uniref:Dynein heavy chain n=1 Tax=Gregarina niphandrodes TaxID=110365 RepID=A0A023B5I3_GRENI|nr:putative dynein heavy chain [Gregarina niphandrodes]EZG61130.1 putative dynein heavy chain [Gregarina niphandrodes]|eukprot:XP_011130783.1 putative dynein heavy chain [Gregarina niphandrodes]